MRFPIFNHPSVHNESHPASLLEPPKSFAIIPILIVHDRAQSTSSSIIQHHPASCLEPTKAFRMRAQIGSNGIHGLSIALRFACFFSLIVDSRLLRFGSFLPFRVGSSSKCIYACAVSRIIANGSISAGRASLQPDDPVESRSLVVTG
jgi:hypothetical protein